MILSSFDYIINERRITDINILWWNDITDINYKQCTIIKIKKIKKNYFKN